MMRAIVLPLVCVLLVLSACSDDDASAEQHDNSPARATVPKGDPRELPKIPADEASIRAMLRERFGEAVARNLRIAVEDSGGGGVRVMTHGEVPTEEICVAVMDELSARVEGLKFEDFDITVAGPIGMLWRFDANIDGKSRFVVFSPDLSLTATTNGEIYETATGRRINRLAIAKLRDITSLAFSPDDKLLATGHWDGQIMLWDMPMGALRKELSPAAPAMRWVLALQFTADGKSLASLSQERGEIHIWDLAGGSARLIGAHMPKDVSGSTTTRGVMAVAPDGKTIASACDYDDGVILWDVAKRSKRDVLKGELFTPEGLAWSKDGRYLAVARFNQPESGTVIVWDLTNKQPRTFTPDHSTTVEAVGFSDDGKTLAIRYENEGIRFWDFPAGQKWLDLPRDKSGGGSSLRFSPGGNVLATEADSLDPAGIRLWNVSARPGASREAVKLPPALGNAVTPRDDLLAQVIEMAVRGLFDPRNIETLSVEVLPDGGVRLTGKVSGPSVKDHAGRIAATQGAGGEIIHEPRRVVNDLEITGRYGELKPPR